MARASVEQTDGVKQVNQAVVQMDQVTQSNAATSQESAAAAQELNSQAEVLRDIVRSLQSLVGSGAAALPQTAESQVRPARRPSFMLTAINGSGRRDGKTALLSIAGEK